jgi:ribonuclease VapC
LYDGVIEAYAKYGKGTGHPARFNFGDCFSYAMAKRLGVSLLYTGNDFVRTDLA